MGSKKEKPSKEVISKEKPPTKAPAPDADDLDDGLDYSFDIGSDDENTHLPTEDQLALEEGSSDEEKQDTVSEAKKHEPTEDSSSKKRKKSQKLVEKKKQKTEDMSVEKKQVTNYPPQLLADFVANKLRKAKPHLSSLELNEQSIGQECFADSTAFSDERRLVNYPKFVKEYLNESLGRGSHIVVICMSAIRACDAHRALQKMGSLKLIKKNSVKHDSNTLKKNRHSLVVTTPGRIEKLVKKEIFDKDTVTAILVDSSYLDPKNYHIWDTKETIPVLKSLTQGQRNPKIYIY